ncbi:MAG: acetate--CoA ligase family protein [Paracoccaceae bacterium]
MASPAIAHKTEAGGVLLGVAPEDAGAAFDRIVATVRARVPDAPIDGVLVSPMAGEGVDVILGMRSDPVFGPVVLVGLGGIFTEVLGDVALRRAPFDAATAHDMIASLKGAALLRGARGAAPADVDALAGAVARFSQFAAHHVGAVESAEINPLRVMAEGEGCLALDALIVRRDVP